MSESNAVVAIFKSNAEAETVVTELQRAGFDMKKISIVGRDYHTNENIVGYYNAGDRMKFWGKMGSLWGGFLGLLVAGPLVGMLVGALEGGLVVGGLSALGAGLYSLGIQRDSIAKYETALVNGKFVVIAHGSTRETFHAREIINRTNPEALAEPQADYASTNIGRWEQGLLP